MENQGKAMEVRGVPTHGGTYVLYNILGNLFEVSSKYSPPIQPVGRGAYGIVWYFCTSSLLIFDDLDYLIHFLWLFILIMISALEFVLLQFMIFDC